VNFLFLTKPLLSLATSYLTPLSLSLPCGNLSTAPPQRPRYLYPNSVSVFDSPTSILPFLSGTKSPSSDLWFFKVPHPHPPTLLFTQALSYPSLHSANFTLFSLPHARYVSYLHRAFGSPSVSTFLRAFTRGFIHGLPQLTPSLVRKFPPLSIPTSLGHLDTLRGIASTRKPTPSTLLGPVLPATPPLYLPLTPH
jgi:hypothetical protein